jgi:hypothetical protein
MSNFSRTLELVDAAQARGEISNDMEISPDLPLSMKEAIVATAMASLSTYFLGGAMSEKTYEMLREEMAFVLLAGFGKAFLQTPSFKATFKLVARDCSDALLADLRKSHD